MSERFKAKPMLNGPDDFPRMPYDAQAERLGSLGLRPRSELLVAERNGERLSFLVNQMIYHHVAQGELGGEPYLVTF